MVGKEYALIEIKNMVQRDMAVRCINNTICEIFKGLRKNIGTSIQMTHNDKEQHEKLGQRWPS